MGRSLEKLLLAVAEWEPRQKDGWIARDAANLPVSVEELERLVTADAENKTTLAASQFERLVCLVAVLQGLDYKWQCYIGKTVYGKRRKVDLVLKQSATGARLAVECKYQDTSGTADEKLPYAVLNQRTLPIPGVIVYGGHGWSDGCIPWLCANSQATDLNNWADWVRFFFGI